MESNFQSLSLSSLLLVLLLISPSVICTSRDDLLIATEEMQRANYFTFVLLINMSPPDKIPPNVTFLMPNDRMLSKIAIPENAVSDFLLRHSIPSALLFDHLQHFPSNSILPSSYSDYMIRILNNGRRSYFLNNVKLISPNICVNGSSVRCHGIDGVLVETSPFSCSSSSIPVSVPPSPPPFEAPPDVPQPLPPPTLALPPPFPAPPPPVNWTQAIAPGPGDTGTRPSSAGALPLPFGGETEFLTGIVVILVLYVYLW